MTSSILWNLKFMPILEEGNLQSSSLRSMKRITLLVGFLGVVAVLLASASEMGPAKTLRTVQSLFPSGREEAPPRFVPTSDELTLDQLETILQEAPVTNVRKGQGQWLFDYEGRAMAVLTSAQHNRMRIVAPIAEVNTLEPEALQKMLIANFHSALDGRYAISNGVVYAVYLHPLSSLQAQDFRSALSQVGQLVSTFGTTYSSGGLSFGAPAPQGNPQDLPEI